MYWPSYWMHFYVLYNIYFRDNQSLLVIWATKRQSHKPPNFRCSTNNRLLTRHYYRHSNATFISTYCWNEKMWCKQPGNTCTNHVAKSLLALKNISFLMFSTRLGYVTKLRLICNLLFNVLSKCTHIYMLTRTFSDRNLWLIWENQL